MLTEGFARAINSNVGITYTDPQMTVERYFIKAIAFNCSSLLYSYFIRIKVT